VALPHARINEFVTKTDMSLICLKEPVVFPGDKKVKIIMPFSSIDQTEHVDALAELVTLVEDYDFVRVVESAKTPIEILKFIRENKKSKDLAN